MLAFVSLAFVSLAFVKDAPGLAGWVANEGAGIGALAGLVFKSEDYGAILPLASKLTKEFDGALLPMQEDGDYDLLIRKFPAEMPGTTASPSRPAQAEVVRLSLNKRL